MTFTPFVLVDDAVAVELLDLDRDPLRRQLLVHEPDLDVGGVGPLKIRHQLLRADRPDDAERRGAPRSNAMSASR